MNTKIRQFCFGNMTNKDIKKEIVRLAIIKILFLLMLWLFGGCHSNPIGPYQREIEKKIEMRRSKKEEDDLVIRDINNDNVSDSNNDNNNNNLGNNQNNGKNNQNNFHISGNKN